MRASRLLSVLLLLQNRGRMTAQELADELEVSVRTVYRDVESLGAAGIPVYAERGATGGYRLLAGYRTRLTGLTGDEAESLFLTGMPGPAAELGLGAVLAGAELKLLAALPPELRTRAERLRERFHLDTSGWFHEADHTPWLTEIAGAVWEQRRLRVRYERWGRPKQVTRDLDPVGLVLKAGRWYVVAAADGAARTYRISRMLAVEPLAERFERPAGFDLADYWRGYAERFETSIYRGEMTVRFSPAGWARLPVFVAPAVTRAARASATEPDADGWVRAVLPYESRDHAVVDVLKLGADAEILDPPDLRARMAALTAELAARYT